MTGGALVSNYHNYVYRDALSLERSRFHVVHRTSMIASSLTINPVLTCQLSILQAFILFCQNFQVDLFPAKSYENNICCCFIHLGVESQCWFLSRIIYKSYSKHCL